MFPEDVACRILLICELVAVICRYERLDGASRRRPHRIGPFQQPVLATPTAPRYSCSSVSAINEVQIPSGLVPHVCA